MHFKYDRRAHAQRDDRTAANGPTTRMRIDHESSHQATRHSGRPKCSRRSGSRGGHRRNGLPCSRWGCLAWCHAWHGATQGAIHVALGGFSRGFFLNRYAQACFTAGTPLVIDFEGNSKPIEEIQVDELVLSCNEFDPQGPLELKRVEEKFVRTAAVMELVINGQTIKTTAEHPFYFPAQERFVPAGELQVGDLLVSSQGTLIPIESITSRNELTTVYNLRVADHHTYFVGGALWGWDMWVHSDVFPLH